MSPLFCQVKLDRKWLHNFSAHVVNAYKNHVIFTILYSTFPAISKIFEWICGAFLCGKIDFRSLQNCFGFCTFSSTRLWLYLALLLLILKVALLRCFLELYQSLLLLLLFALHRCQSLASIRSLISRVHHGQRIPRTFFVIPRACLSTLPFT